MRNQRRFGLASVCGFGNGRPATLTRPRRNASKDRPNAALWHGLWSDPRLAATAICLVYWTKGLYVRGSGAAMVTCRTSALNDAPIEDESCRQPQLGPGAARHRLGVHERGARAG